MSTPERVDPNDSTAFDAWYDVFSVAVDDDRQYAVGWTRDEMRIAVTRENPYKTKEIWSLRDETGEVAGALVLEVPLIDNTSTLNGIIGVRPDARRRGHGWTLGRLLDGRATHHARTILTTQLEVPLPPSSPNAQGAEEGAATAGQAFAAALGFSAANFEVHRVLELPVEDAVLEALAAQAAERHQGYELRSWQDHCPDDLIDAFAALQGTFALEAPQGELEVEAERYDAARIRAGEEEMLAQGRHSWTTVALAADGTLAGHTELQLGAYGAGLVFQWGTLVAPAHRGHRLGLALKARNHLDLQRTHREPMVVHTWNGEENTAMNAVNAKLGFRPVERHEEWQRRD